MPGSAPVLVVDDDDLVRNILISRLEHLNIPAVTAASAEEALAKIDMRLVPDQDPDDIVAKLRKHLDAKGFGDIEITKYSMEHPVRSPADSAIGTAAIAACAEVFDGEPVVSPMMIGTGPMYPIASMLGIPTVSPAGVCRPDSNIHAPNENCRIEDFLSIVEYTVAWLRAYAEG